MEEYVGEGYFTLKDGTIWKFSKSEKQYRGQVLHELDGIDVTELVKKRQLLEEKNRELVAFNERQKEYYLQIDETIKQEEILRSKMEIHDEMNRLMLLTVAAIDSNDKKELEDAYIKWEQASYILAGVKNAEDNRFESVTELADMLGIRICDETGETDLSHIAADLPQEQTELYCLVAREAITNAAKHSDAGTVSPKIIREKGKMIYAFANDGVLPEKEIEFEGGLANLARLLKKYNGTMHIDTKNGFSLIVEIEDKEGE